MKNKCKNKLVGAIKSLKRSNKTDELNQIDDIFPQNLMNDLICDKLKEIVNWQDIIKKKKNWKVYNFSKYSLRIVFLRDIHEGHLSLKDADDEQRIFAAKKKNLDKVKIQLNKTFFK